MFDFINTKSWPFLAFLLSLSLWVGALGFQHIGGMEPCHMCYWQRYAHQSVLALSIIALLLRGVSKANKWDTIFVWLIGLAFLVSFGLAFWHVGVEYKWWAGPKTCSGGGGVVDGTAILQALSSKPEIPQCDQIPWSLFGISMAGYNANISIFAALISLTYARRSPS